MERGTKPHKTVWVCQLTIPHRNGAQERYVSGVFASRDAAVHLSREWLDPHHGQAKVVLHDDSAYLEWPSGNRMTVARHPVNV
jgi:hypothetical protein